MTRRYGTLEDRFWSKVRKFETGCWVWAAALSNIGYPRFTLADGRTVGYAHRVAYELEVGPIPSGYEIDHLCGNRWCVRPDHLEAVTLQENRRRRDAHRRLPRRAKGTAAADFSWRCGWRNERR